MTKKRLDELLVERELVNTLDKAKRSIMAGLVFSGTERLDKPGVKVDSALSIVVKSKAIPYVGRGGLKLEKALKYFSINIKGRTLIDIGSSTGGFTDCALQNGAARSYAVDVGYNQLDWKLRNDPRVVVMERTNFRYVTSEMFAKEKPNFATIDVSFISLKLILPVLKNIIDQNTEVIALIKPQFEAYRNQVGKKGIVREASVHREVINKILEIGYQLGFSIINLTFSPITGGDGNIEFLVFLKWQKEIVNLVKPVDVENVIEESHELLNIKKNIETDY